MTLKPQYKFLIVGASNTAITFALYALLVSLEFNYNFALTVTYLLGIVLGFVLNRVWTFANSETDESSGNAARTKSSSTQFSQYVLVYLFLFVVNFLLLNLLVQVFKLNPILAQLIAVGFSTVCSYALQKAWVFK